MADGRKEQPPSNLPSEEGNPDVFDIRNLRRSRDPQPPEKPRGEAEPPQALPNLHKQPTGVPNPLPESQKPPLNSDKKPPDGGGGSGTGTPKADRKRVGNPEIEASAEDLDRLAEIKRQALRVMPLCHKGDWPAVDHAIKYLEREARPSSPQDPNAPLKEVIDEVSKLHLSFIPKLSFMNCGDHI